MNRIRKFMKSDMRKSDRLRVPLKAYYALTTGSEWIGPVSLENISGEGLNFKNSCKIKKNSRLDFKIDLLDGLSPIVVQADVIWARERPEENYCHIGAKFRKMSYDDRRRYVSFICENILAVNINHTGKIKTR